MGSFRAVGKRWRARRQKRSLDALDTLIFPPIPIPPEDPLAAHLLHVAGTVDLDHVPFDSPALQSLKAAGIKLCVPLIHQGQLIGALHLGPRLSQQDYSTDDRNLLNILALQASPAVRVAQLIREQRAQARERERIEQELRVAKLIQQTLLPKSLPTLSGWQISTHYQPARAVGGDFYDFLPFPDGRLGIIIGDVTNKGVPAALLMATTRSILRAVAKENISPGIALESANDLLYPDTPHSMFVTCFYAILDPASGQLRFANAGHNLPLCRSATSVSELRAVGMPLGLMPHMHYEEKECVMKSGDTLLLYSDGLIEGHNPLGEMFGTPKLTALLAEYRHQDSDTGLIEFLLEAFETFVSQGWEQEDDVTCVTISRQEVAHVMDEWQVLETWTVPSTQQSERSILPEIRAISDAFGLSRARQDRLETAVAEAIINAIEHGNGNRPDLDVTIQILASSPSLAVRIRDSSVNGGEISAMVQPDLEAKIAGRESPRGWGIFLIHQLADKVTITQDEKHHQVEIVMYREGEPYATERA